MTSISDEFTEFDNTLSALESTSFDRELTGINNSSDINYHVHEFDTSVFDEDSTVESTSVSGLSKDSVPKWKGLSLRLSRVEETLGIFYVAFWRVNIDIAVERMTTFCINNLGLSVCTSDFTVVQKLDCRRRGVLLQVSSLKLREDILNNSAVFLRDGLYVARE